MQICCIAMTEMVSQCCPRQKGPLDKDPAESARPRSKMGHEAAPEEEDSQSTSELIEKFVHERVLVDGRAIGHSRNAL